jgi:hypothetical protein
VMKHSSKHAHRPTCAYPLPRRPLAKHQDSIPRFRYTPTPSDKRGVLLPPCYCCSMSTVDGQLVRGGLRSRVVRSDEMLANVVLVMGLLLSTASQLRPAGAKIGVGELCLAIWLLFMLAREIFRLGPPITPALSRLLTFWIVFSVALCLGTMAGYVIGDIHDPALFLHDITAYAIVAAISCLSVVEPRARARLHVACWLLVTIGAAWLSVQVAYGYGLVDLGNFNPWEWDRLRGLSDNSNQLALACAVLGLLSLHLAELANRPGPRIIALMCMTVAVVVGCLTQSNAFLLILLIGTPVFVALKLRTWLLSQEPGLAFRSAAAWILVFALPLVSAYFVPFGASVASQANDVVTRMIRGGTTTEADESAKQRLELWNEAVRRGVESGMLGLGPGPHLEIPPSLDVRVRNSVSFALFQPSLARPNLAPSFEAHNTVLDMFVQGGLLAISVLAWLFGSTLLMTLQARLDALTTLLCGIALFGVFHMIARHPIVWFAIAVCLATAIDARRAATIRAWS